jgi:3',5'-cyclic AMP phosphodiesterase CpdA
MRVLHISDVHVDVPFARVPWQDWIGKRLLAGVVYALNRRRHFRRVPEKLVALAGFAAEHEVDLVIATGDHTALGTEPELARARSQLGPLMERPAGFVHVPGNHDLYLPSALREARFDRVFGDTLATDLPDLAVDHGWPIVRCFGDGIAVVAVNSARPNPSPWRSSGEIPATQLAALEHALADPRIRDRFVFVVTHYAPRRADGRPDGPLHGLDNADAFLAACRRVGRGAILHGHLHSCFRLDLPDLPAIFCAGSTTHEGREGLWLFDVDDRRGADATARRGRFDGAGYVLDGPTAPV